ncbi:bifunctional methylenetetrahydrofolate dehydrogenase/methenyltetrahydrofolate cyclohydrolase FolD [bacterium]|nr:bifunctional methylenetetrahydrofolate dehydrogenase/methenyltetrahydrofolate cyclohydrolase FolD [bacterium]
MTERGQKLDGKVVSAKIREEITREVHKRAKEGRKPGLALVLVGDDPASKVYVNMKQKACEETGILSRIDRMPADSTQEQVLQRVREINADPDYHGLLVQSPLPDALDEDEVVRAIKPEKDVDGFHPYNVGLLALNQPLFIPCTPLGIIEILKHYELDPSGKNVVVIGRSHLVGMPVSLLLARKAEWANATVTICHSRTQNIGEITRSADILIVAIGSAEFVTAEMVKEDAVVIDVGMNRVDDASKKRGYRLVGDVAYSEVREKASWITPVPGGVGPMTVALLLKNTLLAEELMRT